MKRGVELAGIFLILISHSIAESATFSEWKKVGETDGIIGYTRHVENSIYLEVKGEGDVDASVASVEALLRDIPAYKDFLYSTKIAEFLTLPGFSNKPDSFLSYTVYAAGFPVKDRDVVGQCDFTVDKASGTVYLHVHAIKSNYVADDNRIREPLMDAMFMLIPKGPDRTKVIYMSRSDPGGVLPGVVVNIFTKNVGIKTIAGIRAMVKKDKYRNAKSIVTTTPH